MKISDLKEFDISEMLGDEETICHYLTAAFEDGDPSMIQMTLGAVPQRSRAVVKMAQLGKHAVVPA